MAVQEEENVIVISVHSWNEMDNIVFKKEFKDEQHDEAEACYAEMKEKYPHAMAIEKDYATKRSGDDLLDVHKSYGEGPYHEMKSENWTWENEQQKRQKYSSMEDWLENE